MSYRVIDRRQLERVDSPARSTESFGYSLYSTPTSSGDADAFRPRQWWNTDPSDCIGYSRDEILGYSRQLFAQVGELGASIIQKGQYAVGDAWKPQFKGENEAWGAEAEEWLHHVWVPNCDIRGSIFDFSTQLFLSSLAYDVDGDDAVIFTDDGDSGLPKLKFVDSLAIGSGRSGQEIEGGAFDGAKLKDGVICDRNGGVIGIRILGKDGQHIDLSTAQAQLNFEPEWRTPVRGIGRIARVITDWCSIQDIDWFLKLQVKQDSAIGIMHYNEDGRAPTSRSFIEERSGTDSATNPTVDIRRETLFGGQFWYMRAGSGDKLEPYKSERPGANVEEFVRRIRHGGMIAVGWPFELLDPSRIGGASVRAIQDQARKSVRARQKSIYRRALRCVQYAIGVAQERRFIPRNNDPDDMLRWGFELPAELTVDEGYSEQADRENLLMGTTTLASVTQKKGKWWEDVRAQREIENKDRIARAAALVQHAKALGMELTFREALDLVQRDSTTQMKEPTPEPRAPVKQ